MPEDRMMPEDRVMPEDRMMPEDRVMTEDRVMPEDRVMTEDRVMPEDRVIDMWKPKISRKSICNLSADNAFLGSCYFKIIRILIRMGRILLLK